MLPKRQKFLVLGLSRSGKSAATFLLSRGATVYVYDDVTGERATRVAEELCALGAHSVEKEKLEETAKLCDVLVLSPGIPIDHPLAIYFKRNKKSVVGETEIAARFMRCPVIAVTGTNGKTTTVSMLTAVLNDGGYTATACGNIGVPMVEFCSLADTEVAVAEISSFQMETLNSLRPHIAVVLNVTEDHLNRHYTMENYIFLKGKLLKNGTEAEYAVLNYDDKTVRAFAELTKSQTLYFSVRERVNGAYLEDGALYFQGEKIMNAEDLFTGGTHNVQNALAVICCAKIMGIDNTIIARILAEFKGVKHRIQFVEEVDGVRYVDDSKGTNVDATVKAVQTISGETVLLLGGKDKGYDYSKLFTHLQNSNVVHAVLYGENRYKLLQSARERDFERVSVCKSFDLALKIATLQAKTGQTVLLSPASASFDEFSSYEERGDAFAEYVQTIAKEKSKIATVDMDEAERE